MNKQLYRSTDDRVIGGVCGGLAQYFDIDPVIIRLLCVLLFFAKAIGFIAYIVCMIIIPERPFAYNKNEETFNNTSYSQKPDPKHSQNSYNSGNKDDRNRTIFGVILIGFGTFVFAEKLFHWFNFINFGGIILVLAGIYIIFSGKEKNNNEEK